MIRKAGAMPATVPIDFTRLGATPREVTLTRHGRAVMIVATIMAVGAIPLGIGLSTLHVRQMRQAQWRERDGVPAAAKIVAMSPPRGDEQTRRLTFEYAADGLLFTATGTLNKREWRTVKVGDRIAVRYLRSNPQRVWIRGHEPGVVPLVLIPFLASIPAAVAGMMVWRVQRDRTLLSDGRFAYARVVSAKKHQHSAAQIVTYEFKTLSGATRVARSTIGRRAPDVGTVVPVVYHREDPARTALYPLSLVTPAKG